MSSNHHGLLEIDFNVLLYDIVIAHLDDVSWISFGSTCKLLYNKIVNNPNIWEEKLKFQDQYIERALKEEKFLNHFDGKEESIVQNFLRGYHQFRYHMFTRLDSNNSNCLLKDEKSASLEPLINVWRKKSKDLLSQNQQIQEDAKTSIMKIQYLLFKKYRFCNIVSYSDEAHTDVCRHLNHSVMSLKTGFWKSYFVNCRLKPKEVYCWSILLTQFDRLQSNSWSILVGVDFNHREAPEPLNTWLSFGYCIKSNAIVKQSYTSYNVSDLNQEGHLIGFKCIHQKSRVDFYVYLANGVIHHFESKEGIEGICRPIVSLVNGQHMVSILPWDGNVSSLKLTIEDSN
ncbi:hypothetical protein FDP41_006697 [Naegleria fowleri]|uniref:Uncharacterized protein n=1 Tax=Naegleria fowleri TaxID=5763 RepID=A0A6A5BA10_NAEFO|nr:uncharacterized protein FDP41_006697 [Naegleria fowleri]KAF0974087.1 hypothetical protein FDP41_006697 [Naegleria fowleri]CAG4716242.1 unnamed protein product [Naegleria fowleri]